MQHLQSEIEIAAPAARVWHLLTDFSAYASWNPFVRRIGGALTLGARLDVEIQPDGGRVMSFKPQVIVSDPLREFRWKGQLLVPGLFDGEHYFQIGETSPGAVRFVQG